MVVVTANMQHTTLEFHNSKIFCCRKSLKEYQTTIVVSSPPVLRTIFISRLTVIHHFFFSNAQSCTRYYSEANHIFACLFVRTLLPDSMPVTPSEFWIARCISARSDQCVDAHNARNQSRYAELFFPLRAIRSTCTLYMWHGLHREFIHGFVPQYFFFFFK